MRSFYLLVLLLSLGFASYSQEFMGVQVDGKKDAVLSKLKKKGFSIDSDKDEVAILEGKVNGRELQLFVLYSPKTKTVWKISVYLPKKDSWSSLKYDYNEHLDILTEKYGEPESTYDGFDSPYEEGDGNEMTAVAAEKCNYSAFWSDEKGISIFITKWNQVKISYENAKNSKLDDQEKKALNSIF